MYGGIPSDFFLDFGFCFGVAVAGIFSGSSCSLKGQVYHRPRRRFPGPYRLYSVSLARNFGFAARELRRIQSLAEENRDELLEAWHGYFGTG